VAPHGQKELMLGTRETCRSRLLLTPAFEMA
jgi:hypothetical protein